MMFKFNLLTPDCNQKMNWN